MQQHHKYIYLIKSKQSQLYKIGISDNPQKRIKNLQTGNPEDLIIIHTYKTKNYNKVEKALHNRYSYLKLNGEWFEFDVFIEVNFLKECILIDNNLNIINKNNSFI